MSGRLIFMVGVYDTLDIFAYEMKKRLEERGYETMLFDSRDTVGSLSRLYEFIKEKVTAVITFNNLGFNMELVAGQNIWDSLDIWCINILMDHPIYHKSALDNPPKKAVVLCPDRNHMKYVQRFFPNIPIVGFLPHGGKEAGSEKKEINSRSIDILYAGGISLGKAAFPEPDFKGLPFDGKKIGSEALELLIEEPSRTLEDAVEKVLLDNSIALSETELNETITAYKYVDQRATNHYREKVIRTIAHSGLDITVYGTGWENCSWIKDESHMHFMGRVPAEEIVSKMHDAKIVLNTMTWFKDGTHDRVFNGMLSGAAVFTDSSIYMKENFIDELEMFELTEISALPDRIRGLLSDGSAISALADRGRIRAKKDCTLFARADELADDLLSAL